jgi:hypothetical protein
MGFEGANINKLNGGLSLSSVSSDRVIVLICGMTATAQVLAKTVYPLLDITSAETLGITAASDALNGELVHYHLSEMFRLCPGFTFNLLPVAKTTTVTALVLDAAIIAAIRGITNVNVIGIAGIASALLDVINTDVLALQGMVNSFAAEHLLIDGVILEGVAKTSGANYFSNGVDLFDLRTLVGSNISVVISQDPAQTALNAAYAKRASVGTVLGMAAVRKVHEDLGSVALEVYPDNCKGQESYSLTDQITSRWLSAALSDGTPFQNLTSEQQDSLSLKGYIYIGYFKEYPGFYLSGCPTAVALTSDYSYFNMNCIWNKAARIIRKTLIPRVRSKVPKDKTTGYIKSTWISDAQRAVLNKLKPMITANNIDDSSVYINPAQSVNETTPMAVQAMVQVGDIVHEFDVDLGLTSKIS